MNLSDPDSLLILHLVEQELHMPDTFPLILDCQFPSGTCRGIPKISQRIITPNEVHLLGSKCLQ